MRTRSACEEMRIDVLLFHEQDARDGVRDVYLSRYSIPCTCPYLLLSLSVLHGYEVVIGAEEICNTVGADFDYTICNGIDDLIVV